VNATKESRRGRRRRRAEETLDALASLDRYPSLHDVGDLPRRRALPLGRRRPHRRSEGLFGDESARRHAADVLRHPVHHA